MSDSANFRRQYGHLVNERNYWAERIAAQIEFARGLSEIEGKSTWSRLIDRAGQVVQAAVASGKIARLDAAVREAEAILSPIGKAAKKYTIHCVGHAHIDMNWMWAWPETVAVTNDTFATALKLMDEFPDFCLSQSQASVYEIVRQYNPEMFERIKARVAEGRWEVTAVQWVEGDKNLASGESLARHLLYTRQFMKQHFNLEPEDVLIDWEPDTFGHAATIPSIVSRGGVKRYYMCRGGGFAKPPIFWWQGPDGSRVLVNLETTWYNDEITPQNATAMLAFCKRTGLKDWMNVYGVGDHGGGPTRRDIIRCRDMDAWPIFPKFKPATTKKYYEVLEAHSDKWPVLTGELNFEFTGCYTTQTEIKKAVRKGENFCLEAEYAATLARKTLGGAYPRERLREAWVDTIFGHFHDILTGSGVRDTRHWQTALFQKTAAATGIIKTHSLRGLAGAIDTSFAGPVEKVKLVPQQESIAMGAGAGYGLDYGNVTAASHLIDGPRPFVVFNPAAWDRREVVQATIWDSGTGSLAGPLDNKTFVVRTADGRIMPAQKVRWGNYWGHDYIDLAFPADVPSMGYNTFVIEESAPAALTYGLKDAPAEIPGCVKMQSGFRGNEKQPHGPMTLENDFVFARFDRLTGGIVEFIDKVGGRNLADASNPLGVAEFVIERSRGMSAWLIGDAQRRDSIEVNSFWPGQNNGPYQASFVAKAKAGLSEITITYTLRACSPVLEIAVQTLWMERGTGATSHPSLLMKFPLALRNAKGTYEIPYGAIRRDLNQGEEVPALRFADVSGLTVQGGAQAGLTLLNDCKYGYSLTDSTLRVSLVRSAHDPDRLPEAGEHSMLFGIVPHGRALSVAELTRLGAAFNHPLQVVGTDVHPGALAGASSAVTCREPDVVVTSVKVGQYDDSLIVRMYETAGKAVTAHLTLDATLLGKPADAVETDMLERKLAGSTAKVSGQSVSVDIPPHGIATIKVTMK